MQGASGSTLRWPFHGVITLQLIDQTGEDHITHAIDFTSESCHKAGDKCLCGEIGRLLGNIPGCLIPKCLMVRMSNPSVSSPKMSNRLSLCLMMNSVLDIY